MFIWFVCVCLVGVFRCVCKVWVRVWVRGFRFVIILVMFFISVVFWWIRWW